MSFVLGLLLFAPPPASQTVGVAWHEQATVDVGAQQRLVEAAVDELGLPPEAVVRGAVREARRRRAYRISRNEAERLSDLQARLDLAAARFRAGAFDAAADDGALLLERLEDSAALPGISRLAWQVHLLLARIAMVGGDLAAAEVELQLAAALDPTARLSTRRVPPDVAAAYETQRRELLARRDEWQGFEFSADVGGAQVEIDGVVGLRPVPPGQHYVVLRWPGAAPRGVVATVGAPLDVERPPIDVPADLPVDRASAQRICDELELDELVVARVRRRRVGVQTFVCGRGFGPVWYSVGTADGEASWEGLRDAGVLVPAAGNQGRLRSVLLDAAPWPKPPAPPILDRPTISDGGDGEVAKKPWFRRAWVWVLIGSVVVAGVTTGVVLGTQSPTRSVVVDGDEFLQ